MLCCSLHVLCSSGNCYCGHTCLSVCPTLWADTCHGLYRCLFSCWFHLGMCFLILHVFIISGCVLSTKVCQTMQVMSVKALGIALKLTFSGTNQLTYPQTWAFTLVVISCVITQMNYLNKVF